MSKKTTRIKFDIDGCKKPLNKIVQQLEKQFDAVNISVVDTRDLLTELEELVSSFGIACAYKKSKRTDNQVLILTDSKTKKKIYCHVETRIKDRKRIVADSADCNFHDSANSSAEMMLKIKAVLGTVEIKRRDTNADIRYLPTGQIVRRPQKNFC